MAEEAARLVRLQVRACRGMDARSYLRRVPAAELADP